MFENRRHMRFRETTEVLWTILGTEAVGKGTVLNISASGMMLQTDGRYSPKYEGKIFVDSPNPKALPFGAKKGKIVWMRRVSDTVEGYRCGIEFLGGSGYDKLLNAWIDKKTEELAGISNTNIMTHFLE